MRCILAVAFAVVLVVAEGKVLPASDVENQQTANQTPQLADLFREAQAAITTFNTQIQEKLNLPNQEEFMNTVKENANTFASNIQQLAHNITEEVSKNPELENILTNLKNKMTEAVDKMTVNPETTEQINQLRARFQEGVQTVMTESENVAKSISSNSEKLQQDITKFTKDAIDMAVQASQNLNNQLQQAATQAPS
uniref:Apolipophorin 2 n=1 Tax=Odontomachus monticola TaxID=613454 RepID=A0A348G623_ODOMO